MKHSIFDRIYLSFLLILILSFGILITFTSISTKKALTSEREETLTNEAQLIASQTLNSYVSGAFDATDVSRLFTYYAEVLNSDIWYVDKNGVIISSSESSKRGELPNSIYKIYGAYKLNKKHTETGNFHGIYDQDMISINIPLTYQKYDDDNQPLGEPLNMGALIMHSPSMQINSLLKNIFGIVYLPCLIIIIISFTFIQIISRKVMSPVKKLSTVATEYSKGNFDTKTDIHSEDEIGQLAQSMEYMADELSKLEQYRRDFISNISHDFRSPLTSIKGYVEAIKDGTIPPEKQDRYLDIILNETQRLTKLTTGLLDLNNLEQYGPYLKLKDFDLIEIIKPTLNTFEMKCIEKNIAIYLNNHADHTIVTADKTKIQQVIYNLIDNAIKFTPAGKKITVTLTEKKEKIFISVQDEGIGMSEDTQKKIFDRFYKGDQSRGKDKQGTGLGLAITKEIIKAHNENIDVTSTEGAGSTFTFTLTKAQEKASTDVISLSGIIAGKYDVKE